MMTFTGSKNLETNGGGGGSIASGLGGNGLPFVPNVTRTSPSSTTTTTRPSAGYVRSLGQEETAFDERTAAAKAEADAQAKAAQIRANVAGGYGPMAGVPVDSGPPQTVNIGGAPVPIPEDQPDIFETKRAVGQAARDAAYNQELQRQQAAYEQRIRAAHADYDQRYQAAVEASKQTGYWDNKTAEQKATARMGIWLSAIGAGLSGGDNKALAFINDQIKQDTALKAARAERMMKLAELSKGTLADAYRERAEQLSNTTLNHAALAKSIADQAESYVATMIPAQQQAEARQKVAQLEADAASKLAEGHKELNTKIASESGKTVTQEGLGGTGGKGPPTTNEIVDYTTVQSLEKKAQRLDKLSEDPKNVPTPTQIDEFTNNTNAIVGRQIKEAKGNAEVLLGRLGRAFDALPTSAYPKDMSAEQREWMRLHQEQTHYFGVKKFGQSAMSNPESYHEFITPVIYNRNDTQEEGIAKSRETTQQIHDTWANLEASKAGRGEAMIDNQRAKAGLPARGTAPAARPLVQAPSESLAQLSARGRAAKQAGNMAEAKRIHDQITAQLTPKVAQ